MPLCQHHGYWDSPEFASVFPVKHAYDSGLLYHQKRALSSRPNPGLWLARAAQAGGSGAGAFCLLKGKERQKLKILLVLYFIHKNCGNLFGLLYKNSNFCYNYKKYSG